MIDYVALSDASGICVAMLTQLSLHVRYREKRGRDTRKEIKSFRKRGHEKSNRLREKKTVTEEIDAML